MSLGMRLSLETPIRVPPTVTRPLTAITARNPGTPGRTVRTTRIVHIVPTAEDLTTPARATRVVAIPVEAVTR